MAAASLLGGGGSKCPAPFLLESDYPRTGGFVAGRFCAPMPQIAGGQTCCLPCPQTNWVYGDNFQSLARVSNWLNVAGTICCIFLLASFWCLPVQRTHRHYLTVCLILAVLIMQMGFIVPLGSKPNQCFNAITPHDMHSDPSCATSGFFLLAGGWCAATWVFLRSLHLHLQICWQVVAGRKFFISSLVIGWGFPIIMTIIALTVTGVSYRFGDTCHINHEHSLADFWIPLLILAGAALVFQSMTFVYCIKVYLQSLVESGNGQSSTGHSGTLPSYNGSFRTATARQTYRRIQRVIQLQWRGIFMVLLIIGDVIFFSVIFVYMDNTTQVTKKTLEKAQEWLFCLVLSKGDKNKCLDLAAKTVVGESTVMAVLILLSLNGIYCLLLLGRWDMVPGWVELIKTRMTARREFVSIDARRFSHDGHTYEMLKAPGQPSSIIKAPEPALTPTSGSDGTPMGPTPGQGGDYFGAQPRFSSLRISWNPELTHAPRTITRTASPSPLGEKQEKQEGGWPLGKR